VLTSAENPNAATKTKSWNESLSIHEEAARFGLGRRRGKSDSRAMRITIDPARVRETFAKFSSNPSLQESAQLFAHGLPVAEMVQAFAMNERVLRAFAGFDNVYPYGTLERSILEKVILRVSQLRQCQFCTDSHLAIMERLGVATDLSTASAQTERERAAIEYAECITRDSNAIPDALFERLHKLFTDPEIVELTFHVGFITMLNLFNNSLQVRYRAEFNQVEIR
jgi:AhpD family alkylhydroperoxidase